MMRIVTAALLLGVAVVGPQGLASGNGLHGLEPRAEPPTRFEQFLRTDCSPCVRESFPVATLSTPAMRLPGPPAQAPPVMARTGEIRIDVVRAYPLGRPSQQFLAMRATLFGSAGGGQVFRLAVGLVDESDVGLVAAAVADLTQALATPVAEPAAETLEIEVQRGTVRVGAFRAFGAAAGYIQAGEFLGLPPPTPTQPQGALFLPVSELAALEAVLGRVATAMRTLRGK
jgi:hypothetical protein